MATDAASLITGRIERLRQVLAPASIAFVGGSWVAAGIEYCRQLEYAGAITAVNPKHREIGGVRCVATLADMPFVPDVAFVCVNKQAAIGVIAELRELGVAGVVCNAAGFSEIGARGDAFQAELDAARGEMLLFGPNSPGFVNFEARAAVAMERFGVQPPGPGVALIAQGGAIMQDLISSRRGPTLTHMIGVGNQLDVSIPECIEAVLDDARVRGIALYLEGMPEVASLSRAALAAARRGIPIVACKSGRSAPGARAMFSHTASMTSPADAVSAILARIGIIEVGGLPEMLETLKFLTTSGAPRGARCAILTASGMHSAMAGDAAAAAGLDVAMPDETTLAALAEVLPAIATPGNPLDLTTYYWGQREPQARCYSALLGGGYDVALNVTNYPIPDTWDMAAWEEGFRGFADVVDALDVRAATISIFPESFPEAAKREHLARGIAPLQGLTESMQAVANAIAWGKRHGEVLARDPAHVLLPVADAADGLTEVRALDEATAKRRLAAAGLPVPPGVVFERGRLAGVEVPFAGPFAVKLIDAEISHKSELGALRLGVADLAGAEAAAEEIARAVAGQDASLATDRFLLEQMIGDGVAEVCVGVLRIDGLGLALTLAAGGRLTEILRDRCLLMLPASRDEIETAFERLAIARLVDGYRGAAPADRDALFDAIECVGRFAYEHRAQLLELEINPLILRPAGHGVAAADAILRLRVPRS